MSAGTAVPQILSFVLSFTFCLINDQTRKKRTTTRLWAARGMMAIKNQTPHRYCLYCTVNESDRGMAPLPATEAARLPWKEDGRE
jgi:hypothetical protein